MADYFFDFSDRVHLPELVGILATIRAKNLPVAYVAGGTNCLFAFDRFPGIVVHVWLGDSSFVTDGQKLTLKAGSGALMGPLVSESVKIHGVPTLIPWVGLPGTIGGAVVGNAGCFGLEANQIVKRVEVLDTFTGEASFLSNAELGYAYRTSVLKWQDRHIVLSAEFDLSYTQTENPFTRLSMAEMLTTRRAKQPPGLSCGSYFANPPGTSAGKLIDQAGLKGSRVGGMQISPHHANFFVSSEWAVWQDVIQLAELAKSKVREMFQTELREEVRIIK